MGDSAAEENENENAAGNENCSVVGDDADAVVVVGLGNKCSEEGEKSQDKGRGQDQVLVKTLPEHASGGTKRYTEKSAKEIVTEFPLFQAKERIGKARARNFSNPFRRDENGELVYGHPTSSTTNANANASVNGNGSGKTRPGSGDGSMRDNNNNSDNNTFNNSTNANERNNDNDNSNSNRGSGSSNSSATAAPGGDGDGNGSSSRNGFTKDESKDTIRYTRGLANDVIARTSTSTNTSSNNVNQNGSREEDKPPMTELKASTSDSHRGPEEDVNKDNKETKGEPGDMGVEGEGEDRQWRAWREKKRKERRSLSAKRGWENVEARASLRGGG